MCDSKVLSLLYYMTYVGCHWQRGLQAIKYQLFYMVPLQNTFALWSTYEWMNQSVNEQKWTALRFVRWKNIGTCSCRANNFSHCQQFGKSLHSVKSVSGEWLHGGGLWLVCLAHNCDITKAVVANVLQCMPRSFFYFYCMYPLPMKFFCTAGFWFSSP